LDQLGEALCLATSSDVIDHEQIGTSAGRNGRELLGAGLTVGQVVHEYGAVCQSITELAIRMETPITGEEFQTLNLCLDDAIAGAVTEHARQRELAIEGMGTERLGVLAHELRNSLGAAMMAFESIQNGHVGMGGSTASLLARSLMNLHRLIDRSLAAVRLDAGIEHFEKISVAELVDDVELAIVQEARARDIRFAVTSGASIETIEGDRQILAATLSNLLQNALKFTHAGGSVSLITRVSDDRILFDIEDECGGLPPGKAEELFRPFEQRGADRSGLGLGLFISLKAAKVNGGEIRVRDLPNKGCVFTLDLPRKPLPPLSAVEKRSSDSPATSPRISDR
jgi:signal transduction histidine kinase